MNGKTEHFKHLSDLLLSLIDRISFSGSSKHTYICQLDNQISIKKVKRRFKIAHYSYNKCEIF